MADTAANRIFSLIDNHNLGAAGGLLEDALAKYPNDHAILASEVLLLQRTGATTSAIAKARYLGALKPTNQSCLAAFTHALQQLRLWPELIEVYQRMLAAKPGDASLTENLFLAQVRSGDFAAGQKTAMQLQKLGAKNGAEWVVMCQLAQVPEGDGTHLLLKLATRMLQMLLPKTSSPLNMTNLMLDVYLQQGMHDEAMAFVCSKQGAKLGLPDQRLDALRRCFVAAGKADDANAVSAELWRRESDHWNHVTALLDSIPLADADVASGVTTPVKFEDEEPLELKRVPTLKSALAMAEALQAEEEATRAKKARRGPFLAALEIKRRMGEEVQAADCLAFAKRFATKATCFLDLTPYLTEAAAAAISEWANGDAKDAGEQPKSGSLGDHQRKMLALRCRVAVEKTPCAEDALTLVRECLAAHTASSGLSEDLVWSEEGHTDGYLVVAANVCLRQMAAASGDSSAAARWAELGLGCVVDAPRFTSNPALMLLALCFGYRINVVHSAALQQLDFKSVQCESMAHVALVPALNLGASRTVASWSETAETYFGVLSRDASRLRAKVFEHCSFRKLAEIQRFEDLAKGSIAYQEAEALRVVLRLADCQAFKERLSVTREQQAPILAVLRMKAGSITPPREDRTVVGSVVLGAIGSDAHSALVEALLPKAAAAPVPRLHAAQILAAAAGLAGDAIEIAERRNRKKAASSGGGRRNKKEKAKPVAPDEPLLVESEAALVEGVIAAQPDARWKPVWTSLVTSVVAAANEGKGAAAHKAVKDALAALTAEDFTGACQLQAQALVALLAACDPADFPVVEWASSIETALQAALAASTAAAAEKTSEEESMPKLVANISGLVTATREQRAAALRVMQSEVEAVKRRK